MRDFEDWQVDAEMMQRARPDALFMHCLPAHRGEEVAAEVIDGPRSVVRHAMGVQYEGSSQEQRDFFGGQMMSIHFRSSDLYAKLANGPLSTPSWQCWIVNPEMRGILVAINGISMTHRTETHTKAGRIKRSSTVMAINAIRKTHLLFPFCIQT